MSGAIIDLHLIVHFLSSLPLWTTTFYSRHLSIRPSSPPPISPPPALPGPSTTATPATSIFESRRLSIGRPRPPVPPGESSQRRTGSIDGVRSAAASRAGLAGLGGLQHVASLSRSGAPAAQGVGLPKDFPGEREILTEEREPVPSQRISVDDKLIHMQSERPPCNAFCLS